jgi:tRNA (guanine9-N1)-methyltransferase
MADVVDESNRRSEHDETFTSTNEMGVTTSDIVLLSENSKHKEMQKISKQKIKKTRKKENWKNTRTILKRQKRQKQSQEKWIKFASKAEYLQSERHKKVQFQEQMKKKWKNVSTDEITWFKPWIVIDLDWNDVLTEKEMSSLAAQLMHIYGAMKRSDRPLKLYLTSLKGKIKDILYKIKGAPNWKVVQEERDYLQLFPKDQLVYLSPESNNILRSINSEKIYIIGGLVDHNRLKGISFKKATAQGIETAKLPVKEYIERFTNTSLNVNHVFAILMDVARDGDWKAALLKYVPTRRGYIRRDDESNNSVHLPPKKIKTESNNNTNNNNNSDDKSTDDNTTNMMQLQEMRTQKFCDI